MKPLKGIPIEDLLIIGTHYPVETYPGSVAHLDEVNWTERHFWSGGTLLRDRIRDWRNSAPTLWLCGDTHYSDHLTLEGQHFVMTGRLGTRTGTSSSQVRRQAKIVCIGCTGSAPMVHTLTRTPLGHVDHPDLGRWEHSEAGVRSLQKVVQVVTPAVAEASRSDRVDASGTLEHVAVPIGTVQLVRPGVSGVNLVDRVDASTQAVESPTANGSLEVIDEVLQSEVLATIRDRRLYSLGRFNTSASEVTLSWVSIGPLLNEEGMFANLVDRMVSWLRRRLASSPQDDSVFERTLLLGIDCWGAVLASQISVMTAAANICVAARAKGRHHTALETVSPTVFDAVKRSNVIVLVSDVVATARSLRYVHDEIVAGLPDETSRKCRWLALSVICDSSQTRPVDSSFIEAHGTACAKLRMPILPTTALPDEQILPPRLSFA